MPDTSGKGGPGGAGELRSRAAGTHATPTRAKRGTRTASAGDRVLWRRLLPPNQFPAPRSSDSQRSGELLILGVRSRARIRRVARKKIPGPRFPRCSCFGLRVGGRAHGMQNHPRAAADASATAPRSVGRAVSSLRPRASAMLARVALPRVPPWPADLAPEGQCRTVPAQQHRRLLRVQATSDEAVKCSGRGPSADKRFWRTLGGPGGGSFAAGPRTRSPPRRLVFGIAARWQPDHGATRDKAL